MANGESAYFVWLNRGKESICLDIKDAADRELLLRICDAADVFIQNLAPGAAARAGFDSAELRRRHPRLITVDITGYGDDGPYRTMKAYDLLVQCETGLASITGAPEAPGRVGVSICDIACGMYAHAAVLIILSDRNIGPKTLPIPAAAAVGGVQTALAENNLRCDANIIIETAEVRDPHHFAVLIGFGATAVYPYLVYETLAKMVDDEAIRLPLRTVLNNYRTGINKGLPALPEPSPRNSTLPVI